MYFKSEPGREQLGSYYQLKINYLGLFLYSVFFFTACVQIGLYFTVNCTTSPEIKKEIYGRSLITCVELQQLSSLTENDCWFI